MLSLCKPHFLICESPKKGFKDQKMVNEFMEKMCESQRDAERYFVHKQSLSDPRPQCEVFRNLRNKSDVRQSVSHGENIRIMSNSETITEALLNKTNCLMSSEEKIRKGIDVKTMKAKGAEKELCSFAESETLHKDEFQGVYVDDVTGGTLDPSLSKKAREAEMKSFEEMGVYEYVPKELAMKDANGKIVGVRWVDVLKGEDVRSRLVAQEFASGDDRDDIFAATPPLFATKMCISDAASCSMDGPGDRALMVLDVKRAFLYGDIEATVYIRLPPEDPMHDKGYVGLLEKAMYGTRGAPKVWH